MEQAAMKPWDKLDGEGGTAYTAFLIFRDMRLTMKISRETIARRLATSISTIDSFEAGVIGLEDQCRRRVALTLVAGCSL